MFGNNVVENHVQTRTEVHEEGGEGSPGAVAVLFPIQHQESKAHMEGQEADEHLHQERDDDPDGLLFDLGFQLRCLAMEETVNDDQVAPNHDEHRDQEEEYQSSEVQHIDGFEVNDVRDL